MEKEVALSILEDLQNCLNKDNWKSETLKNIKIYKKNLQIAIDDNIRELIEKQKDLIDKYGENDKRTLKMNKKIGKELQKIFNS